ncbi:MAG TPA: DUF951 domain-containing protein [Chloroflexota bacterium]|nr:DUF951 domain-containing protein [Chloroflexota bacterium]
MPSQAPFEFRIEDRLQLRKPHPCGGLTWVVARLGADIGLTCETCGRHIMLPRSTLERRLRKVLARGPVPREAPAPSREPGARDEMTCELLGLRAGDVLAPAVEIPVTVSYFYTSGVDRGSARLGAGQAVRVALPPATGATTLMLEPVDYGAFELRWVPGGVRTHEAYTGYALEIACSDIARHFRPVNPTARHAEGA